MATISKTQVDLTGLMKVLGESLYSTPNVALRELVQNAHDSLHRRRIEDAAPFEPRIDVQGAGRSLVIEDTGAGLTRDEIDRYLATVGSGYTRTLRDGGRSDALIGYFGLGFLSAYVVSDKTEVHTCSYQTPDESWLFSSRQGHSYTVTSADPRPVGTRVTLHLSDDFTDLGESGHLRDLLERYCGLLEFPVHCGGTAINSDTPPWRNPDLASRLRRNQRMIEFAERFETAFVPLTALALPDAEAAPCRGMVWIQDGGSYSTSDNRNAWVFVRGMMVTNEDREILPGWAGFAGAVIESDRLAPTASRESLQRNHDYDEAAAFIRESIIDGLATLSRDEPETWRRVRTRHNEALRGAAIADDRLFDLLAAEVTVPTTDGEMTLPAVAERGGGTVYVSTSEQGGFREVLFRALKVPVVRGYMFASLPFCRRFCERRGGKLVELGTDGGDTELFRPAEAADDAREMFARWFAADDVDVVLSEFEPTHLPLVLVPNEEVLLKRAIESDDADRRMTSAALSLARTFTGGIANEAAARLYLNMRSPAVQGLVDAAPRARDRAIALMKSLAAVLSGGREARLMQADEALRLFADTVCDILGDD